MKPPYALGKEAIRAAALSLFRERGVDGTSIRDIAKQAGLTNPALYRHYPTKEALAADLFREAYQRLIGAMRSTLASDGTPSVRLQQLIGQVLTLAKEAPEAWLFAQDQSGRFFPQIAEVGQTPISLLEALLEEGIRSGEFRHEDPTLLGGLVVGALFQTARLVALGKLDVPFEQVVEASACASLRIVAP